MSIWLVTVIAIIVVLGYILILFKEVKEKVLNALRWGGTLLILIYILIRMFLRSKRFWKKSLPKQEWDTLKQSLSSPNEEDILFAFEIINNLYLKNAQILNLINMSFDEKVMQRCFKGYDCISNDVFWMYFEYLVKEKNCFRLIKRIIF